MLYLHNGLDKTLTITVTENPITNPQQSPNPTQHKDLHQLDENDPQDKLKIQEILNHPNYSETYEIKLKPGRNEFKNHEWAEYIYKLFGEGYIEQFPDGPEVEHFINECDEEGNILSKSDSQLYRKHRARRGVSLGGYARPSVEQFREEPQVEKVEKVEKVNEKSE